MQFNSLMPSISRDALATKIITLRAYIAYYGIEFDNLGSPERRTIYYTIPDTYVIDKRHPIPILKSIKLLDGTDLFTIEPLVLRERLNELVRDYITLDDICNEIIHFESIKNRPILDTEYRQIWKKQIEWHRHMMTVKSIVKEISTYEMNQRLCQFLRIVQSTV